MMSNVYQSLVHEQADAIAIQQFHVKYHVLPRILKETIWNIAKRQVDDDIQQRMSEVRVE